MPSEAGGRRHGRLLTAAEAARRLGVKPATLYAYVSRGVLSRAKAPDGRASLFGAEEVERLARRGRPRRPAGIADITVESAITEITGDSLRFRGLDATSLAVSRTFEEVAELLWTGEFRPAREPWRARPAALAAGPGRAGRAARRDPAARAAPGDRPGHGGDRPAPAPARPAGRTRGRAEHHRRHGRLPALGRSRGYATSRSPGGCGPGSATAGPCPGCCARCPRRSCCWPTTNSPPPRWPSGPPPRYGRIRTRWSGPAWAR